MRTVQIVRTRPQFAAAVKAAMPINLPANVHQLAFSASPWLDDDGTKSFEMLRLAWQIKYRESPTELVATVTVNSDREMKALEGRWK
jgi:hypothetical protein